MCSFLVKFCQLEFRKALLIKFKCSLVKYVRMEGTLKESTVGEDQRRGKDGIGILALLPIEMWEEILDKVEDSKDLRNFCKAWKYPDWDKRLHRTKQCWLFDQVFPLIFSYIPTKSQILLCRLVCKRWQTAIDYFLENNSSRRPHPSSCDFTYTRLALQTKFLHSKGLLHTSVSADKISRILNIPQETFPILQRNPIVGRSVYFNLPENQESSLLKQEFLKSVGHHIWDIRIEIREDTPLKFFKSLERQLKYLPNLRRLDIFGIIPIISEEFQIDQKSLNLPNLNYLETLKIIISGPNKDLIMNTILETYSSQLLRLKLHCYKIFPFCKLDYLTELTINLDSHSQLAALRHSQLSNVRKLSLANLRNSRTGSEPDFTKKFQIINDLSFTQNLKYLLIEFPVTYSYPPVPWNNQEAFPILKLPRLQTLELKNGTFQSFNFISQLSSLEYLHLYKYRSIDKSAEENEEILDLKKILDNTKELQVCSIYNCNLWKVFPRLKQFTISKAGNSYSNDVEQSFWRNYSTQLAFK